MRKLELYCLLCVYRHEDGYRDKRVVIVGVGNTACDVAVDLSSVCSQVSTSQ